MLLGRWRIGWRRLSPCCVCHTDTSRTKSLSQWWCHFPGWWWRCVGKAQPEGDVYPRGRAVRHLVWFVWFINPGLALHTPLCPTPQFSLPAPLPSTKAQPQTLQGPRDAILTFTSTNVPFRVHIIQMRWGGDGRYLNFLGCKLRELLVIRSMQSGFFWPGNLKNSKKKKKSILG